MPTAIERERLEKARMVFSEEVSKIYPFIFRRINTSSLTDEQKEFAYSHCYALLRRYILYIGDDIPPDNDPFSYLDSIGC